MGKMEYNIIEVVEEESKEGNIKIPKKRLIDMKEELKTESMHLGVPMNRGEELDGKAIWLDYDYDWVFGKTKEGNLVCIPLRRGD